MTRTWQLRSDSLDWRQLHFVLVIILVTKCNQREDIDRCCAADASLRCRVPLWQTVHRGHEHTTEPKGVTRECPTPRATQASVAKPIAY